MSGGCEWKPFFLLPEAYAEVVGALKEVKSRMDQEEEFRRKAREAAERGDEKAADLHFESCRIGVKLVSLSEPYMERSRERRGR